MEAFLTRVKDQLTSASDQLVNATAQGMLVVQKGINVTNSEPPHVTFQRNFNLPPSEVPAFEYACRMVSEKKVYLRGVLYISQNFFAFQAATPFQSYRISVPLAEVTSVQWTPQRTLLVETEKNFTLEMGEFSIATHPFDKLWSAWQQICLRKSAGLPVHISVPAPQQEEVHIEAEAKPEAAEPVDEEPIPEVTTAEEPTVEPTVEPEQPTEEPAPAVVPAPVISAPAPAPVDAQVHSEEEEEEEEEEMVAV
ncbi:hypothetical protein J8273_8156 [Carpediemonas membranifera]|uniref:GRAM domain-containing protein n=1 Tax=Carpediemonas membranifera TaxID=201153 RepID=A0A8J6APW3_9EUKA|nr:hypothetical protein J8273_8156 [Carpediemonas membranifera]|eukprot:KAG9390118.1 hypothetical protein J8273_8156 [Carpediemonas membranifera]